MIRNSYQTNGIEIVKLITLASKNNLGVMPTNYKYSRGAGNFFPSLRELFQTIWEQNTLAIPTTEEYYQ